MLEAAHTRCYGDQAGILGFTYRSSLDAGLEFDSSAHDVFITRMRLLLRYMFGNDIRGGPSGSL
ncbi:hypothetical protein QTI66_39390 [Variovorax sp. J22R133]|uniref:hypothetical protein n=1 Tax=Variovorax brevis TaxID=3053503 RepID=UPI002576BC9D|nr:hypothetical protein [Variovorax sp. J22R133]MDM0118134.1 hypothetical protein [Variovorax sp. J22R133]